MRFCHLWQYRQNPCQLNSGNARQSLELYSLLTDMQLENMPSHLFYGQTSLYLLTWHSNRILTELILAIYCGVEIQ